MQSIIDTLKFSKQQGLGMGYEEFVDESIEFFENAKKRHEDKLDEVSKLRAAQQLQKEIETFDEFIGYWRQEKNRIELSKKYQK